MELTTTGGNITVVGSNLSASESLISDSAQDIKITAGYDDSFKEEKTKEGEFFRNGQIYSENEDLQGKMTKTAVASNISAANLTLKSNRELLIEGSNLSGGSITGEAQNITVKAAENEEKTWSKHTSKSIGVGELKDSLFRPDKAGKFEDGKLTFKLSDVQYKESDKSVKKTTVTSPNLDGENISLTANSKEEYEGNILVEGSNLNASDTTSLTAPMM